MDRETRWETPAPRALVAAVVGALAVLSGGVRDSRGATIMMDVSNGVGQSWLTATCWDDDQPAHAGTLADPTNYVVGAGFVVRTPNTGSNTFPGDSLTMDAGQFNMTSTSGTTTTVNNFALQASGVIVNAVPNSTHILAGTLSVAPAETGIIRTAGTAAGGARHITVDSLVSGGGTLYALQRGNVTLTNAGNTFSGTWRVGGIGIVAGTGGTFSNASNAVTTLKATTAGSLGINADVVAGDFGIFDPDYDWTTAGSLTLNTDGSLILDNVAQHLTVNGLVIGGTPLSAGTYTYTELSSTYPGFIAPGGDSSASITVVPEPASAVALIAVGALGLSRRRLRR